jgi:hypothetical protein
MTRVRHLLLYEKNRQVLQQKQHLPRPRTGASVLCCSACPLAGALVGGARSALPFFWGHGIP